MKTLFDLFPVLLFFGAYKLFDIYVATGVMMAATVVQLHLFARAQPAFDAKGHPHHGAGLWCGHPGLARRALY